MRNTAVGARLLWILIAATAIVVAGASSRAEGLPPAPKWIATPGQGNTALPVAPSPVEPATPVATPPQQQRPPSAAPARSDHPPAAGSTARRGVAAPQPASPRRPKADGNSVIITNRSGTVQANYPIQFGHPFLEREIPDSPQIVMDGTPLPTQADVKARFADGSVKHAILSAVVPSLPVDKSVVLTFRNQSAPANTPIGPAEMLGDQFNFDATIEAASPTFAPGQLRRVSAREMLAAAGGCADDVTASPTSRCAYWTRGAIATSVILADHSQKHAYDFGFTMPAQPVRPIFHVTFWPGIRRVSVRFIGEIANTEAMQDDVYGFNLTVGRERKAVYSKPEFVHHYGTRWTKLFWIGSAPEPKVDIDHNLAYLARTRLVANYDTAQSAEAPLERMWSAWQRAPRDIGERGLWTTYMGTVGGRPEIGNMPSWSVYWLYTGDWRAREMAITQADLAGNWALHAREGRPGKTLDRDHKVPALGRTATVYGRPSLWLFDNRGRPTPDDAVRIANPPGLMMVDTAAGKPADSFGRNALSLPKNPKYAWIDPRFAKVAESFFDGWVADGAHQPDPFFAPYLLTGDYWYLEELQMWVGARSLGYCAASDTYCRGPGAGIEDEVRGNAWVLRNRVNAAVASPDGSPEKTVFTAMVDDALARWEGQHTITGTPYEGNPMWRAGYERITRDRVLPSPLHFWSHEGGRALEGLVTERDRPGTIPVGGGISPWMQNFLILELGRATELGFRAHALFAWVGSNLIGQLTDPGFNPFLCQAYRMPVTKADGTFLTTWAEVLRGFPVGGPDALGSQQGRALSLGPGSYSVIARAAASMLTALPQGAKAWESANSLLGSRSSEVDISWSIVPRQVEAGRSAGAARVKND